MLRWRPFEFTPTFELNEFKVQVPYLRSTIKSDHLFSVLSVTVVSFKFTCSLQL